MNILVFGGNRFFGKHLVQRLIERGHDVTVATRGLRGDGFGDRVRRLRLDHTDPEDMKEKLRGKRWDLVYDNIAYCSNDVKRALDALDCGRYILTSTISVYKDLREGLREEDFDPLQKELVWCDRPAYDYGEVKRQGECALFQAYPQVDAAAVRLPIVIGEDDYTGRLRFYVDHIMRNEPMFIDFPDARLPLITAGEAARFLEFIGTSGFRGAVQICCGTTVSVREMMDYVTLKTGKVPLITRDGEEAPYNGVAGFSLNTARAEGLGYALSPLHEDLHRILDYFINAGASQR